MDLLPNGLMTVIIVDDQAVVSSCFSFGLILIQFLIESREIWLTISQIVSSVNFLLNESNIAVHDPDNVLRKYTDRNTASGGVIEVCIKPRAIEPDNK